MRASVDASDYDRRTPLHIASASGSISACHCLISALADVNCIDRWGNTALVDALETSVESAALLIKLTDCKLPAHFANDGLLNAQYAAASSLNMYITNRRLHVRADRRKQVEAKKMVKRREVGLACRKLTDELGKLGKLQSSLFRLLA
jgi:ankyrin repeat protein